MQNRKCLGMQKCKSSQLYFWCGLCPSKFSLIGHTIRILLCKEYAKLNRKRTIRFLSVALHTHIDIKIIFNFQKIIRLSEKIFVCLYTSILFVIPKFKEDTFQVPGAYVRMCTCLDCNGPCKLFPSIAVFQKKNKTPGEKH